VVSIASAQNAIIPFRECRRFLARARSSLTAIFTRSARESAFIFCIILPWWAFIVISLIPSFKPTCLFNMPETTDLFRHQGQLRGAREHNGWRSTASSSIGFVKNSAAPAFIAWTVIGTSPCPVMKMIDMSMRSVPINFWQFESVEVWKRNVKHQAVGNQRPWE